MKITNKIRNLACGAFLALSQAGNALAAEDNTTYSMRGKFETLLTSAPDLLKGALLFLYDGISGIFWPLVVIAIFAVGIYAALSNAGSGGSPSDQARHENKIVGILVIVGMTIGGAAVVYILYANFA